MGQRCSTHLWPGAAEAGGGLLLVRGHCELSARRDQDCPNLKFYTVLAQDRSDSLCLQIQIQNFFWERRTGCAWQNAVWLAWLWSCWRHAACAPLDAGSVCSARALFRCPGVVSCVAVFVMASCGALGAWLCCVLWPRVVAFLCRCVLRGCVFVDVSRLAFRVALVPRALTTRCRVSPLCNRAFCSLLPFWIQRCYHTPKVHGFWHLLDVPRVIRKGRQTLVQFMTRQCLRLRAQSRVRYVTRQKFHRYRRRRRTRQLAPVGDIRWRFCCRRVRMLRLVIIDLRLLQRQHWMRTTSLLSTEIDGSELQSRESAGALLEDGKLSASLRRGRIPSLG